MVRRWGSRLAAVAIVAGCGILPSWFVLTTPALAAAICPSCYGFTRLEDGIFVESNMPAEKRNLLFSSVTSAKEDVVKYFGKLSRHPTIVACATETCDKRVGGRGARASTYSFPGGSVLRLSPRGLDRTIVTHEWVHVEVHARIGVLHQIRGAVPAWFDEGLAVIISKDERYLKSGASAAERCTQPAEAGLPVSPFEWGPLAGKSPMIYAKAGCTVLNWLEANGGNTGLMIALEEVAKGGRRLP